MVDPSQPTMVSTKLLVCGATMNDAQKALLEAVEKLGGQSATARRLSELTGKTVRQSNVWYWLKAGLPPRFARPLEEASGIPAHRLCPEIFDRRKPPE